MTMDKVSTVQMVLSTLLDKVCVCFRGRGEVWFHYHSKLILLFSKLYCNIRVTDCHWFDFAGMIYNIFNSKPIKMQKNMKIVHYLCPLVRIQSTSKVFFQVVKNPYVTKTSKIKLFNDNTLKHLARLYRWTGPVKYREGEEQGEVRSKDVYRRWSVS